MGVGDFVVDTFKAPRSGGAKAGVGLGGAIGSAVSPGGNIGGSVQPMGQQSQPYTGGPVVGINPGTGQVNVLGQPATTNGGLADHITAEWQRQQQAQTNSAPRDWYDSVGASLPTSAPATPVSAIPFGFADESPMGADPRLMELLAKIGGQYQNGVDYANQDNALNQQQLELKRRLLGIDQANVGLDRDSINNRRAGTERDSQFLQQMRALYGDEYANSLKKIQTQQDIQLLDHENAYVSGGAYFAPGQMYRKTRINDSADQSRESARINLEQQQIGVDRSLNNNTVQMGEYDIDMKRLDNKMKAYGINFEQLGLNSQQLQLALNKRIYDLGLDAWFSAEDIFAAAMDGGGETGQYAQQMLAEFFGNGGTGMIMPVPGQ